MILSVPPWRLFAAALLLALPTCGRADGPDCTAPEAWPGSMAFTHLKNGGVVDGAGLDLGKTKVTRIASEKIGKDLYRQVHLVRFVRKSGEEVNAITVNDASHEECSMSDVTVYAITKRLGGEQTTTNGERSAPR